MGEYTKNLISEISLIIILIITLDANFVKVNFLAFFLMG